MDFEKYKFRLNLKACCLYEQLTGNNFLKMSNEEDLLSLLYCCLVSNNDNLLMTFDVFKVLIKDKKVSKWINKEYEKCMNFSMQLKQDAEDDEGGEGESKEEVTMTDVVSSLIVRYGVDPHYVMYEMDLWEIKPYLDAAEAQRKADLITQRFWTYLQILPHIDKKKLRSPEELVPFDWEKKDKKSQKEFEENATAAFKFLAGGKEEKDKEEEINKVIATEE